MDEILGVRRNDGSLSPNSYPKFYPHITLASLPLKMEDELDHIEAAIPKPVKTIQCPFAAVEIGQHYFRSVYVAIRPTSDLLSLHEEVHKNLGVEPRTPSFPHLSLCYIDDGDASNGERENFYNDLETKKVMVRTPEADRIELNCGFKGQEELLGHVDAHEIWVVRTEGPVEGWEILRRVSLG